MVVAAENGRGRVAAASCTREVGVALSSERVYLYSSPAPHPNYSSTPASPSPSPPSPLRA